MNDKFRIITVLFFAGMIWACKHKESVASKETILEGKATVHVDESLMPIIEEEVAVFESQYNAKITLVAKSETEIVQDLLKDKAKIAILSRDLTAEEKQFFNSKNRFPKVTPFATDAIAVIGNLATTDTIINLDKILSKLKGLEVDEIKALVFDNPNSGTVRHLLQLANVESLPGRGVYSFKNSEEVMEFVAENPGMLGIVGINWIVQPSAKGEKFLTKIRVLSVSKSAGSIAYKPSQNSLATGKYPLARHLHVANLQGYDGLGMGFGSFITGERGQRIILKAGLLPERIPSRKIVIKRPVTNQKQ